MREGATLALVWCTPFSNRESSLRMRGAYKMLEVLLIRVHSHECSRITPVITQLVKYYIVYAVQPIYLLVSICLYKSDLHVSKN